MASYTYLWEFEVSETYRQRFERRYGPDGAWTRLFRLSPDFIGTLLLTDRARPGRYVTVDRWASEEAYLAFRSTYAQQYQTLDQECEQLSAGETFLGGFTEHGI